MIYKNNVLEAGGDGDSGKGKSKKGKSKKGKSKKGKSKKGKSKSSSGMFFVPKGGGKIKRIG